MPTAVKEETWELNLGTPGLETPLDPTPEDGAEPVTFQEYEVPVGVSLVFTREDTFSLYFTKVVSPTQIGAAYLVDVVVADSAKQNIRSLLQKTRYGNVKIFDDADQLAHLDIAPGDQIIVREGERILIRGNADAQIDGSLCYFRLTCNRIRHTLFG